MRTKVVSLGLVLLGFIFLLVIGGTEQPFSPRKDRCWSVWLELKPCNITIDEIKVYSVTFDEEEVSTSDTMLAKPNLIILQWQQELPQGDQLWLQAGYSIMDLFSDMAQKIYVVLIRGRHLETNKTYTGSMWISPIGLAQYPLPPAPKRSNRTTIFWSELEKLDFQKWIFKHYWVHSGVFKDPRIGQDSFFHLKYKYDKRIKMVFNINGECNSIKGDDVYINFDNVIVNSRMY